MVKCQFSKTDSNLGFSSVDISFLGLECPMLPSRAVYIYVKYSFQLSLSLWLFVALLSSSNIAHTGLISKQSLSHVKNTFFIETARVSDLS